MRLVHDVVTRSQLLLLPNPMAHVSSSSVAPPQSKAALPPLLLASVYSYLYLSLAFLWFEIEIGNESLVLFSFFIVFCVGLAGVTNSVHSYDVLTRKWTR